MADASNVFARFRFDAKRARTATLEAGDGGAEDAEPQPPPVLESPSARKKRREGEEEEARPAAPASTVIASDSVTAVVATPTPRSKWQERWHGICDACFASGSKCLHHDERLLRLLVVGHNPSDHAWQSGYSYSNPTNRMWSLIVGSLPPLSWTGILPAGTPVTMQNAMPYLYGVGFTSIGLEPGNDAAKYTKETMAQWKADFFQRLRAHAKRVCENQHGSASAAKSEGGGEGAAPRCTRPHGPLLIAFSGKRQFSFLFTPPLSKVANYGVQTRLPQEWPRECIPESEVWVLPSSSGRSALTHEQRSTPYRQLAERLHQIPWPFESEEMMKQDANGTERYDVNQDVADTPAAAGDVKLERCE